MNPPDWLPDMAPVSGDWDQILRELYAIFVADLKEAKRQLRGGQSGGIGEFYRASVMRKAFGTSFQGMTDLREKGYLIPDAPSACHGVVP